MKLNWIALQQKYSKIFNQYHIGVFLSIAFIKLCSLTLHEVALNRFHVKLLCIIKMDNLVILLLSSSLKKCVLSMQITDLNIFQSINNDSSLSQFMNIESSLEFNFHSPNISLGDGSATIQFTQNKAAFRNTKHIC